MRVASTSHTDPTYRLGAASLVVAAGAILTALGFEFLGGYEPCHLCSMERWAYYAGIPLLFAALVALAGGRRSGAIALFALVCLAFLANAGLGAYHAGAEWGFWPGPTTCSGTSALPSSAADMFKGLGTVRVIRCDQASWRLFGLSFAGWNAVISAGLAITAFRAAMGSSKASSRMKSRFSF